MVLTPDWELITKVDGSIPGFDNNFSTLNSKKNQHGTFIQANESWHMSGDLGVEVQIQASPSTFDPGLPNQQKITIKVKEYQVLLK